MDQGVRPSVVTISVLIDERCKKGKLHEANRFLELMIQRGVVPNVYTYNILMNGLCKTGKISPAIKLLEELAKGNEESGVICRPNFVTYSTIIDGLWKFGLVKKAIDLNFEMKSSGTTPNVVTYSILINMLCKNGQLEKPNELLSHMEEKGCAPDQKPQPAAERLYDCHRTKNAVDMRTLLSREICFAVIHAVIVTMIHEDLVDMGFQTVTGIYEAA
ncbi:putative pentatricopeptide repeat-containing protein At1g12700, mitochondrial [Pistacia vera]|uniref:putative pentatricopeptide repeat-containing protein At1g12700, mitochondrial n=1 Tax=Pistacia vera TaxID=55513 RepID=UPI001262F888|nr:putative pentatricopeptide repeat-containing protein At1g12700, mitochondrial [Pistacia vera]